MKKKQLRRLAKASKKMRNMQSGKLSGDQIIDNFAYLIKTYKLLNKEGNHETQENNS